MLNSLKAIELLKKVALRPTKQRIALTKILFQENHLHVTAEQLHSEAIRKGYKISLATVYNALNRFKDAGIVKQVLVEPGKIYFDTTVNQVEITIRLEKSKDADPRSRK